MKNTLIKLNEDLKLNYNQLDALEKGNTKREWMNLLIKNLVETGKKDQYNNLYIYSSAGLGKTFTVSNFLDNLDVKHFLVTGNTSLFAFGIQIATIQYLNPEFEEIIIHVDDCDTLFATDTGCNAMKKMLDQDRRFVYEKSLANLINSLSDIQRSAINHFNEEGKMGFNVPTENIKFIFTSNLQLPFDDEVILSRKKSKSKASILAHQNAIRSRCKVGDFELTKEEHWGWIADVVINTNCINKDQIDIDQKIEILEFLWNNWDKLKERSIRLVEKMAITKHQFIENYIKVWELDYLKN